MNQEQQRIAIAEACGWTHVERYHDKDEIIIVGLPPDEAGRKECRKSQCTPSIPNYLTDLNAMHEAEKVLADDPTTPYLEHLIKLNELDKKSKLAAYHCTAAQRAEAFLKALNLWTE